MVKKYFVGTIIDVFALLYFVVYVLFVSDCRIDRESENTMKLLRFTYLLSKQQASWNQNVHNKLYAIQPVLGVWVPGFRPIRREEVVLSRCRIRHTRITHSYLLKREIQPECVPCQEPFTVKHLLIDCTDLVTRQKYFQVNF